MNETGRPPSGLPAIGRSRILSQQNIHSDRILILDFGSQWTQLIARRVREIGVFCEIRPPDMDASALKAFNPQIGRASCWERV